MGEGNCPGEPGLEAVGTNLPQPLQLLCLHLQGMAVVLGMPQKALGCPKTSPMQWQSWASHGATGACHPAPFARTKSGIAQAPPQPCPAPSRRRRARSWRCRCGQLFRRKRGNGWDRVVIATAGSSWAKQRGTAPLQPLQREPGALQEPQHPAGWEQGILASPLPSITRRRCGLDPHVGVPPRLCSVQAGPHRCHQHRLQQQGPARELPVSGSWQRHCWKRTPRGCSSTLPSPAPPPPCKERGNPSSSWGLGAFGGAGIPGTTLRGHPQPQHLPRAAGPAQGGPRGCPQGRREPPGLTHGAPVPGHLPFCLESSTPFSCFEKLFIKKCSKLSREILRHLAS